jgi:hypothetical protein
MIDDGIMRNIYRFGFGEYFFRLIGDDADEDLKKIVE